MVTTGTEHGVIATGAMASLCTTVPALSCLSISSETSRQTFAKPLWHLLTRGHPTRVRFLHHGGRKCFIWTRLLCSGPPAVVMSRSADVSSRSGAEARSGINIYI